MKDLVKCCNCDFEGAVETGEETCPKCNRDGCLTWQDDKHQEIPE